MLLKNPNYPGPRPQPFDAIAVKVQTAPGVAIGQILSGQLDAEMLDAGDPISGAASAIASEWGPESEHAAQGHQRWFGGPRPGVDYIALNGTRPAFRDLNVRRAVALARDRAAITRIWVTGRTTGLLVPGVPGSSSVGPVPGPDLDAARPLMHGRTLDVTMMVFPEKWTCGACRDFDVAVTGQLKAIGITVTVRHPADSPADAMQPGSDIDILQTRYKHGFAGPRLPHRRAPRRHVARQCQPGQAGSAGGPERAGPDRWCGRIRSPARRRAGAHSADRLSGLPVLHVPPAKQAARQPSETGRLSSREVVTYLYSPIRPMLALVPGASLTKLLDDFVTAPARHAATSIINP